MRTICLMNHKGGVGKTTTAINLAAGISREGRKVLLLDLDPQGNIDLSLRVRAENNIFDAMTGEAMLSNCIVSLGKNFDIISSTETLAKAEYYLYRQDDSKMMLRTMLNSISGYDYLIIDCPPSLGILNQNVLAFVKEVFVPTSTDFLGFDALMKMEKIVDKINDTYNNNCKITKIIPTLYDKRNKICKQTLADLQERFDGLTSTPIRMNSKLKEAPKKGKSIFKYAKSSSGAKDYGALVEEVLEMETKNPDCKLGIIQQMMFWVFGVNFGRSPKLTIKRRLIILIFFIFYFLYSIDSMVWSACQNYYRPASPKAYRSWFSRIGFNIIFVATAGPAVFGISVY